jgi:hypothetical protein
MSIRSETLVPGRLVALNTRIKGNVLYIKETIEADHITEDGKKKARWETERVVNDPAEHDRATQVRSKARAIVSRVCASSAFGLLCPESRVADLDAAINEARRLASDFNASSIFSKVSVYVITGKIAADDAEALKAINAELRDLLETMQNGVANLEVDAIREAATKAKQLGTMLSDSAKERVQTAINIARAAANKISKAGEQAAVEVDLAAVRKIAAMRTAFLDLDEPTDMAAPVVNGVAVELEPGDFETVPETAETMTPAEKAWATRKAKAAQIEVAA